VRLIFRRYAELGSIRSLKEELDAQGLTSKCWTSTSGRLWGGKRFARGALYLMLQNRIYRGEIVHHELLDVPGWDAQPGGPIGLSSATFPGLRQVIDREVGTGIKRGEVTGWGQPRSGKSSAARRRSAATSPPWRSQSPRCSMPSRR
jgi:hypothetical protein